MARVKSIDVLRGLVMVIMALDHVRDMVAVPPPNGFRFESASAPLFFTRWVTHICAPTFVLLAGLSACLSQTKHPSKGHVARHLVLRGLWLIVAELTIVNFAWTFWASGEYMAIFQVIWAIGMSMIVLAGLLWLPRGVHFAIALVIVVGHNLLDGIQPTGDNASYLWRFLHIQGIVVVRGSTIGFVLYPLIPWIGVMSLGYCLGPMFTRSSPKRGGRLVVGGILMCLAFVVVRAINGYGDANLWQTQTTWGRTIIDFLDVSKYPPSLLFLLMTLGPACLLLGTFENAQGRWSEFLAVFGRVPFLFYVSHLLLSHSLTYVVGFTQGFTAGELHGIFSGMPATFGLTLWQVYIVWIAVVIVLYPLCRWFASVKAVRRDWWLSYL